MLLQLVLLPLLAIYAGARNLPEERAVAIQDKSYLWPNGKIYYYVSMGKDAFTPTPDIQILMKIWESATCLNFEYFEEHWYSSDPATYLFFRYYGEDKGCTFESVPPKQTGKGYGTIILAKRCEKGRPLMTALSYALGLRAGGNDDYSIMSGQKANKPGSGTSVIPSFNDFEIINKLYNCHTKCATKINCQNGGYVLPKNCNKCVCPTGVYGDKCQHKASADAPSGDWKKQILKTATIGSNGGVFEEIIGSKLEAKFGSAAFGGAAGAAAGNTIKAILKGEHENVPYTAAGGASGALFANHFSKKLTSKVESKVLKKALESGMGGAISGSVEGLLKGKPVDAIKGAISGGIGDAVGAAVGEAIGEAIGMEFGGPVGAIVVGAVAEVAGELVGIAVDKLFDEVESLTHYYAPMADPEFWKAFGPLP